MKQAKEFILKFLNKEAECWSRSHLNDLEAFNQSVRELYAMAIDDLDEGLGIFEEDRLIENEHPITYKPRHLFKLSTYQNNVYGTIWVATVSVKNPDTEPKADVFFQGFIIAHVKDELKIIGTMVTDPSSMKTEGWRASVYNPSDLDIQKLGEFVVTERYFEPGNYDGFSLDAYLKDN